jgi:nucleotide-binding universal stress UspA family protein
MSEHILVVQGSRPTSHHAFRYAVQLAKRVGASVSVLAVAEPEVEHTYWLAVQQTMFEEKERQFRETLSALVNLGEEEGVAVEGHIVSGLMDEEVVRYVEANKSISMVIVEGAEPGKGKEPSSWSQLLAAVRDALSLPVITVAPRPAPALATARTK